MTDNKAIEIIGISAYRYPSDEYSKDDIYEAMEIARKSIYGMHKYDANMQYMYYKGKNFCKNTLQITLFISSLISIALLFILSFFVNNMSNKFEATIAAIIIQDVILYIVYRIIDIKDGDDADYYHG